MTNQERTSAARKFRIGERDYTVERFQNQLNGPHLRVTTSDISGAVMTRGIEPGSLPFWVGGYAIDEPSLRVAIASQVAELCDPKPRSA
ncbi:hypothetical protein [Glycomyces sp. NRRL B-16210]|uniref:hypothetical protein n=1 Tax=Glycomyces sp. NRRL B-16210 TaxID=1463821 RepID=UPI0004C1A494|nr:hypothetical protein [Glycomyces sp. NRRL B-16210]